MDYKDDGLIVRTVGPDWVNKGDLPSLTKANTIDWGGFGNESQAFLDISVTTDDDVSDEEDAEDSSADIEGYEEVQ